MIEEAKSGRAKCRTCKEKIEKGGLRFGEVDYTFSSEGSFKWHHLPCAAKSVPDGLQEALETYEGEVPDKEALLEACAEGRKGTAFPRAEPAPSGRAKCVACGEKIEKDALRIVIERMVEAIGRPRPAYLHPACAKDHEEVDGGDDLLATLTANSAIDEARLAELTSALA